MQTQNQYVQNQQNTSAVNRPEKKIRAGPISATIWKNNLNSKDGQSFEVRSVSIERGYKDKDGIWKNTSSLRLNDLPRARLVLEEAYRYLVLKGEQEAVA